MDIRVNVERLASKWETEAEIIEQSDTGKRLARLAAAEALRACARDLRTLPDLNPWRADAIVHHIDGDPTNNDPDNLEVGIVDGTPKPAPTP